MALGSGLSATLGIASETTVGTPVVVTRFTEFDSETLAMKKHTVQGAGLRGGGLVHRAQRRAVVAREAAGDIAFDVPTNGFGLYLTHMLGSFNPTITSVGAGLYQQVHNIGALAGHAFTTQIVKPDTTGVLTQEAFTYTGCKVTDWELSTAQHGQVKAKLTIDALDEATPSNAFASTTISANTTAGATSFTAPVGTLPPGAYVVLDTGLNAEVVQIGATTGSVAPYSVAITSPGGAKLPHSSGAYVGAATSAQYGPAATLQAASYVATSMFNFAGGSLIAGGSTTNTGGVWTNTGGLVVANVRSVSLKGKNAVKVDRWGQGQQVRSEQLDNNWREYTADFEVEYNSRSFYDAYAADLPIALVQKWTSPNGASLQFYAPVGFQQDGAAPAVSGPDIIIQKLAMDILDDGTNGALQVVYVSTDSAV